MTDHVVACPECDEATRVAKRVRLGGYRCDGCGAVFEEPTIRESRQPQNCRVGGLSPAGKAALEWGSK